MYELEEHEEEMERVHIYVVPERAKPARKSMLSLLCVPFLFMCLTSFDISAQFIRVPAHVLPVQTLITTVAIRPSATTVIPATNARGMLTVYNGSILVQQLPKGFIVATSDGQEITVDHVVVVPAGNPPSYGIAHVQAHAITAGETGNIASFAINAIYGSSLYLKNLTSFAGGTDSYTEALATDADKQLALSSARYKLHTQIKTHLLDRPCGETTTEQNLMLSVSWSCQFVQYRVPAGVQVESIERMDNSVVLQVRR